VWPIHIPTTLAAGVPTSFEERRHELMVVQPGGPMHAYKIDSAQGLWLALDAAVRMVPTNLASIYTIHAASMLGRLLRWHARLRNLELRPAFQPPQLRDIVDEVNAPAVLSVNMRHGFNLAQYEQLLGLQPQPGYDRETGLLLALLQTYDR
jgi:hypothetical protein